MIIAHIAFQYGCCNTGGAAIAATRLHRALLAHGVDSHYICVHQREPGVNVHELPRGWWRTFFLTLTKAIRCVWKFTTYRCSVCLNLVPLFGLEETLKELKPDVVHVQWINADVCSFEQLAKLPYKMVFNLHDLYLLNFLKNDRTWLERSLRRRKERLVQRKASAFITPSNWVCKTICQSQLGYGIPSYAISNIIDECYFDDPPARARNEKFVILFGAYGGRRNGFKGFSDLESALALLPDEVKSRCELRVFGEESEPCVIAGVSTKFFGEVTNPVLLREIYCAADILAFPSLQETQGMIKIEALLCGLPVVAFDRAACAEGVEHRRTGWIAADGDRHGFADGIIHYFQQWEQGDIEATRGLIGRLARSRYLAGELVNRIEEVYRMMAQDSKGD